MKNKEQFENSVSVLVNAFFTSTLAKGTCSACAVGNLVADGMNGKIIKMSRRDFETGLNRLSYSCLDKDNIKNDGFMDFNKSQNNYAWKDLFFTAGGNQTVKFDHVKDEEVVKNVNATNYSFWELMRIELAFETNTHIHIKYYSKSSEKHIINDQFKGLMAVLDILFDIHEVEQDQKEEYEKMFSDHELVNT